MFLSKRKLWYSNNCWHFSKTFSFINRSTKESKGFPTGLNRLIEQVWTPRHFVATSFGRKLFGRQTFDRHTVSKETRRPIDCQPRKRCRCKHCVGQTFIRPNIESTKNWVDQTSSQRNCFRSKGREPSSRFSTWKNHCHRSLTTSSTEPTLSEAEATTKRATCPSEWSSTLPSEPSESLETML